MGRLVIIASFFQGGALEVRQIQARERTVIGSSMYTAEDYRLAIRLWGRGYLQALPSLITERIRLEDAPGVVAALARGEKVDSIKTIIQFD
jgi:threonine dehydrogenase-like Zn-dependent dehydrogenase